VVGQPQRGDSGGGRPGEQQESAGGGPSDCSGGNAREQRRDQHNRERDPGEGADPLVGLLVGEAGHEREQADDQRADRKPGDEQASEHQRRPRRRGHDALGRWPGGRAVDQWASDCAGEGTPECPARPETVEHDPTHEHASQKDHGNQSAGECDDGCGERVDDAGVHRKRGCAGPAGSGDG
jgi:hypothetical protein